MVYCTKCGAKNEDDAILCVKCGASLQTGAHPSRRYEHQHTEEECFGIPRGGAIAGVIFGIIIIFFGLSWLMGFKFWKVFLPLIIIVFGILVLAGALYGLRRRP
ncbi:MAG: hypothetical protein AOA65_0013 [Candidatus Bathyarchaeota archaeon BA1]|nr:MAG: hypothetical protein AOA65_0013 [Candidatus Bathyarchaeota archaeon BA1]